MNIWIVIYNDDNGITFDTAYSERDTNALAHEYVSLDWERHGYGDIPIDWRSAQDVLHDNGWIDGVQVEAVDLDIGKLFAGVTRADLAAFGECSTDREGNPCVWLNQYSCDCEGDGTAWDNRWSCQCDDTCPTCGRSVSPHTSTFIADVPPALEALWASLPEAN